MEKITGTIKEDTITGKLPELLITEVIIIPDPPQRIYRRPNPTGQRTIYEDYDDAWKVANNVDTYEPPLEGLPMQIDKNVFWKLTGTTNIFEHLFRWTGLTGGYYDPDTDEYKDVDGSTTTEALAFPDAYVIDHFTGLAFMNARLGQANLTSILTQVNDYSIAGFDDFYLPNMNEYMSVSDMEEKFPSYNTKPFQNWGGSQKHTATTYKPNTAYNWQLQLQGHVQASTKTSSKFGIPMRYHFT